MISAERYISSTYNGCVFCNHDPLLLLFGSDHFAVLLDPFALTPGHLLIISKQHYGCFGELPENLLMEYGTVKQKTQNLLRTHFGKTIRYEHGRAGHCLNRHPKHKFCYHFHEHWLPADADIHPKLAEIYPGYTLMNDSQIPYMYERYGHYLLFENNEGIKKFYVVDKTAPPHLSRTLIAEKLGYPERQNWESYKDCNLMIQGRAILEKRNKTYAA